MRLEKCSFCSKNVLPGHGTTFVRNDAKIFHFCSSRCNKHFKAKRNPRKVKWTKAYRRLSNKDLAVDTTFEFEKRRNRPVRYNRDLYEKTVTAMKRIRQIQVDREARHHQMRKMNEAAIFLKRHEETQRKIALKKGKITDDLAKVSIINETKFEEAAPMVQEKKQRTKKSTKKLVEQEINL